MFAYAVTEASNDLAKILQNVESTEEIVTRAVITEMMGERLSKRNRIFFCWSNPSEAYTNAKQMYQSLQSEPLILKYVMEDDQDCKIICTGYYLRNGVIDFDEAIEIQVSDFNSKRLSKPVQNISNLHEKINNELKSQDEDLNSESIEPVSEKTPLLFNHVQLKVALSQYVNTSQKDPGWCDFFCGCMCFFGCGSEEKSLKAAKKLLSVTKGYNVTFTAGELEICRQGKLGKLLKEYNVDITKYSEGNSQQQVMLDDLKFNMF